MFPSPTTPQRSEEIRIKDRSIITQKFLRQTHKEHAMAKEKFSSLPTIKASLGSGDRQHIACEARNNNHTTVILYTFDINRLQIQKLKRQATKRFIRDPIIVQGVWVSPYTWLRLLTDMTGITVILNSGIQIIKLQTGHRNTPRTN